MNNNKIQSNLPPELPKQVPPQIPSQQPQLQPTPEYQQQTQHEQNINKSLFFSNLSLKQKKTKKRDMFLIVLAIILGVGFTLFFMLNVNKNQQSTTVNTNAKTKSWYNKAIEDSTHLANGYFSTSVMNDFDTFIKRYNELEIMSIQSHPKEVTDSSIIRFGNRNANMALAILSDSNTVYRNKFTKILEKKLWVDNIKVKTQNNGKTLWLIGGYFASNRNILEFQKASEPMFKSLEYKRICYKWADISSAEYTYYDLDK